MGFGFFPNFFNSEAWMLSIAGYIIKNRQIPIGTEIPDTCHELIASPTPGITWDKNIPSNIQIPIHSGKYFSKILSSFPCICSSDFEYASNSDKHLRFFVDPASLDAIIDNIYFPLSVLFLLVLSQAFLI